VDTSEYLGLFLDESRESLQTLNRSLLALERDAGDREALNTIFRVAHSLKGMSATMGFDRMAELTHRMEEVLTILRDGGAPVTRETMDTLFACLDLLEGVVEDVACGAEEGGRDTAPLLARLDDVARAASGTAPGDAEGAGGAPRGEGGSTSRGGGALTQYERLVMVEARARGLQVHRLDVTLSESCMLKAARAYMVLQQLERHGEVLKAEPPAEALEQEAFGRSFSLWVATQHDAAELRELPLGVSEVEDCTVETVDLDGEADPGDSAAPPPEAAAAPGAGAASGGQTPASAAGPGSGDRPGGRPGDRQDRRQRQPTTVRVGTDRLDSLMNLMGEMVIQRTRLTQLAAEHDLPGLRQTAEEITRVTGDLQLLVMQVRMMPVETVFMRFPRMVRDLANSLGKRLELVISGEETELDRTVIDELGDPLVHLLRNAVDHGLETPEERRAAGKPEVGTVRLAARHEGNSVVIVVEEDGRGIDPERLRRTVVAKGLMTEDDVRQLTDREALELIFLPGFSTASETTDVSGRGVGMDAVRAKINGLNGSVEIESEVGVGTRFTIRLPLTLAIIQALLVRAAGHTYALPLEATEETVVVRRDEMRPVAGRDCMILRDRIVPLVRLREQLGVAAGEEEDEDEIQVVVVRSGGSRIGVVVDRLLGQQDVVIKHLPDYLGDIIGVAGATILGDGQVALIVDVSALGQAKGALA
jgi:two-component system chemotaxis sensor kinase CheA